MTRTRTVLIALAYMASLAALVDIPRLQEVSAGSLVSGDLVTSEQRVLWTMSASPSRLFLPIGYPRRAELVVTATPICEGRSCDRPWTLITLTVAEVPSEIHVAFDMGPQLLLPTRGTVAQPMTMQATQQAKEGAYIVKVTGESNYAERQTIDIELAVITEPELTVRTQPPVQGLGLRIDGIDHQTDAMGELRLKLKAGHHRLELSDDDHIVDTWETDFENIHQQWSSPIIAVELSGPMEIVLITREARPIQWGPYLAVVTIALALAIVVAVVRRNYVGRIRESD